MRKEIITGLFYILPEQCYRSKLCWKVLYVISNGRKPPAVQSVTVCYHYILTIVFF